MTEADFGNLMAILPPPQGTEIPIVDWKLVIDQAGPLPDDYKRFCDVYGPGTINRFTWINHPNMGLPTQLKDRVAKIRARLQQYIELNEDEDPLANPAFSDVSSLLPCGGTDNGHIFLWITDGNPNDWQIAVCDNKGRFFESGEVGVVRFLVSLLTKQSELLDHVIAGSWFDSPRFLPYRRASGS